MIGLSLFELSQASHLGLEQGQAYRTAAFKGEPHGWDILDLRSGREALSLLVSKRIYGGTKRLNTG